MKRLYSRRSLLLAVVLLTNGYFLDGQITDFSSVNTGYSGDEFGDLIWSDECDGTGPIDTTKWFHQTKLPNGTSWWNDEIQHYTDRLANSFNDTGTMHLVAKKETYTDQGITKQYTSARLNSKFAFTYGKVEIRAILPAGAGTWPAMWTLGKNVTEDGGYWYIRGYGTTGWPECGEIDIMEHWGTNQDYVSSAMHTPSSYGNTVNKGGRIVENASSEFHVYRMEWTPEKMVFSIDSIIHYTYDPAVKDADTWPFDEDQYLLLNIAVLPTIEDDFSESPMIIDYVRIYEYIASSTSREKDYFQPAIYPNPFVDKLTVEIDRAVNAVVEIHSLNGQLIYKTQLSGTSRQLDLASIKKGVYLLTIRSKDFVTTRKIVKL